MSKCGRNDRNDTGGKKQRRTVTLEKLDVIRRYERNEHTVNIVNAMENPELTTRIISKQADKIKERCKSATRMTASKIALVRALIIEKLERMLAWWSEHQHCFIPVSTIIIQAKAKRLFGNHLMILECILYCTTLKVTHFP
jgi:hypothetical protein